MNLQSIIFYFSLTSLYCSSSLLSSSHKTENIHHQDIGPATAAIMLVSFRGFPYMYNISSEPLPINLLMWEKQNEKY
jgi:hypothetical protein